MKGDYEKMKNAPHVIPKNQSLIYMSRSDDEPTIKIVRKMHPMKEHYESVIEDISDKVDEISNQLINVDSLVKSIFQYMTNKDYQQQTRIEALERDNRKLAECLDMLDNENEQKDSIIHTLKEELKRTKKASP